MLPFCLASEVEMIWGSVKNFEKNSGGGLCILYRTYTGGEAPPYKYNTKYTSPLRFFDTPSIHSNLLQMLQKKKNFYNTSKGRPIP